MAEEVTQRAQAAANLQEGLAIFCHTAMGALRRLDEQQALSDTLYARWMRMGVLEWWWREFLCKWRGHDWRDVPKPILIQRWCGRCWKIEDYR